VFDASSPFAFFDYFRVPYDVRPPQPADSMAGSFGSVHQLHARAQPGDAPGSLLWLAADARPASASAGYRLGLYTMSDFTFSAHVALNAAVPAMLAEFGNDWRPAEPVRGADARPVAAVWRDSAGQVFLPFDPGEVMHRFWSEQYRSVGRSALSIAGHAAARRGYYALRPALPRALQLRLRRVFTRLQARSTFPGWPVEDSLHNFYDWLFSLVAGLAGRPVPFLDPWPGGRSWAFVLTHDVETETGYREMELLRGPERDRGYVSSWNFVGLRYGVGDDTVRALHEDGCEVGVHGLRHDGRDLGSRRLLERRLPVMRDYAEKWNAVGFRSPATHRAWELMPLLGFDYDSSYSDSDPYEPQPGGCCSYLPYFNNAMVELPITLPQDHTLFTILQRPDADLWIRKAEHIRQRGGMALVLTHPDYAHDQRLAAGYRQLLDAFAGDESAWHALPRDVAAWWRKRAASTLREHNGSWGIDGPASAGGRVRFARAGGARVSIGARALDASEPDATPGPSADSKRAAEVGTAGLPTSAMVVPAARRKTPHVLLIVENVPLGIDIRVRKQVRDLLGGGYRVSVVTRRDPQNASYRGLPGMRVLEYPAPPEPGSALGYVREYAAAFAWAAALSMAVRLRGRVDVVQFCQPPDVYFPLGWLLRWSGAKVVIDQRDLMPELFAARYEQPRPAVMSALRWLERRTQRVCHNTISVNGYLRRRLIGAGAAGDRVAVVRNGPILGRVGRTAADPSLRDGHHFLCCWTGKMGRQDRVDLLLRAVAHIVADLGRTDCRFAILGDGEALDDLRSESARLGLEPWVTFPGWLPEQQVFTYLATADLGLDTSLQNEVSPVKVMEYMAFGLPFVAFDLQETRVIGAGASALITPGDVESLAEEIVTLLDDPARRAEMGAAGRLRVREELAWERQVPVYLGVIDSLSRKGPEPEGQPPGVPENTGSDSAIRQRADHLGRGS
jgi:glycosyltransferase involved in cell wall biosynthesis